jgi:hypothetical protein
MALRHTTPRARQRFFFAIERRGAIRTAQVLTEPQREKSECRVRPSSFKVRVQ